MNLKLDQDSEWDMKDLKRFSNLESLKVDGIEGDSFESNLFRLTKRRDDAGGEHGGCTACQGQADAGHATA
jgi:hypothetical protein